MTLPVWISQIDPTAQLQINATVVPAVTNGNVTLAILNDTVYIGAGSGAAVYITGGTIDNTEIGSVSPSSADFTTLAASGTTTLLQGTGRDITISDGGTFAGITVANNNPLYLRSLVAIESLDAPQNKVEFKVVGYSGNTITLTGANTYGLISGNTTIAGTTSAAIYPYNFACLSNLNNTSTFGVHNVFSNLTMGNNAGGAHTAIQGLVTVNGTGITSANPVGGQFGVQIDSNVGGVSGTNVGRAYGGYFQAGMASGATFWDLLSGGEVDVGVPTGASVGEVDGWSVVMLANHKTHGLNGRDSGFVFGYQTGATTGWDYGIRFGGVEAASPFMSTSTLLWVGRTMTIATGIDFTNATITGDFLASTGFAVDGSGNTVAASVAIGTGGPTWTSGAGVPSSTQPKGSMYSRTGGGVGTTLYVSQGGGTWNPVAGV